MAASTFLYYFRDHDEEEYWQLIQGQLKPYHPTFADMTLKQSQFERGQGRCAVVVFKDDGETEITKFKGPEELRSYLGPRKPISQILRRLFILEDLPLNYITALGSHLRIPPNFFAGHCDDPALYTFNHRNPFLRSSKNQIRLRYPMASRVELDVPQADTNIYAFNSYVRRHLHVYTEKSLIYDEARSYHTLSFWGSPVRGDGSWDAVFLTDPPLGDYVRSTASQQLVRLRHTLRDERSMPNIFLHPEINLYHELPEDSSLWKEAYSTPRYKSMFDDSLEILATIKSNQANQHPIEAIEVPHKLLISHFMAFIRRRYHQLVTVQKSQQAFRNGYLSDFTEGCFANWNNVFYDYIVGTCAAMKEFLREVNENISELGLDRPHNVIMAEGVPQWQIDGWKCIQEHTRFVDSLAQSFAARYLQFVSVQEARVSNSNALNLSRITVLTMLFIPLSTIASIFSMSGDYLPGEKRAWVYWVASMSVLVLLVCLYWQRRILELLKKGQKTHSVLHEFVSKKNSGG